MKSTPDDASPGSPEAPMDIGRESPYPRAVDEGAGKPRRRRGLLGRIPRGALMLSAISVLNVALGFAREAILAYYFGTSAELDAFLIAYTLPRVIVLQAIQITVWVMLPLYVAHLEGGRRDEATALLRAWFVFLAKATTIFCLIVALIAPIITYLIGPGLTADQRHEAANWLRWLLPYVWVTTMSGCFKVVLDQNRRFFAPAMSSAFVSMAVIGACLVAASDMGVAATIPGFLIGGSVGYLWQWYQSRAYEPTMTSFRNVPKHVKLPLASGVIMVINSFALQANVIIDRAFASYLPEGSIAALNYANSLIMVFQNIIGMALGTSLFPILSEMIARGEWRRAYRTTLGWTGVVVLFLLVPSLGMMIFRHDVVRLVFQRGAFGAQATEMTAHVLLVLSFMVMVFGANVLIMRLLLAQQQLRLILWTTILMVVLKIIINALLVSRYQLLGVAIATVAAGATTTAVRIWGGRRYAGGRTGTLTPDHPAVS